jgi:hypothetical protein
MSAIPVLMMLMGVAMAFFDPEQMNEGMEKYGYPEGSATVILVLEVICVVIYVIPQTAVLGAILLTGYLGGATATHVRAEEIQYLVPVAVGILVWGGLFLRDPRIRALIPLRK